MTLSETTSALDVVRRLNRWDNAKRTILRTLWLQGAMLKQIAHETGMSLNSCKEERAKIGLLPRRARGENKVHNLTVYFSDEQWAEMRKAAFGRYGSMAQYIRAVVARDCGRPRMLDTGEPKEPVGYRRQEPSDDG